MRRTSHKAIWSLSLAIVGAVLGIGVLPLACSVAAIVQGIRARRDIRCEAMLKGERLATAGIVLGVLALLLYAGLFIAIRLSGGGWGGANTIA